MSEWYAHPRRFFKNVPGPFYTLGEACGDCLWCGLPEEEASDLLAPLGNNNTDTYFVKQPQLSEEIEQACCAIEVCCVGALRYGGKDSTVLKRLHSDYCDFRLDKSGRAVRNRSVRLLQRLRRVQDVVAKIARLFTRYGHDG